MPLAQHRRIPMLFDSFIITCSSFGHTDYTSIYLSVQNFVLEDYMVPGLQVWYCTRYSSVDAFLSINLYWSSTRKGFYPERPSEQDVVAGFSPLSPPILA